MIELESRQNIRFRTACDPCSTAKVRCDKKHPACDRCVQTKLKCSYSESRKHGRQSWRQRLASERSKMATIAAAEGRPLAPTKPPTTTATSADQPGWESLLAGPAPLIAGDQTWESLLNAEQNQFDTDLLSSWPSDSALHTGIDIGGLDNWDSGAIPIQEPAGESPSVSTNDTSESSTHNCEAQAISILNSMQHGEMYQGFTSCPTDPTQAYAQLVLSPTFDRVIAVNKAALEGWNKLVRCACAQCPHLLLLYTSILSKMVFWYRIAATEKLASSDCADSGGSSPSSGRKRSLPEEAPTVDRFSVRPTAIQVGMLSLDAEDQADLRRVLLLRELRRTVQAIDDLLNLDRRTIEEGADEFIRSSVQWTLTGISRLKEELQGVMQQVKQMQ